MSKWIRVDDKLPDVDDYYLVTGLDIELEITNFCPDFGWQDSYEITHWMPLPEPPRND